MPQKACGDSIPGMAAGEWEPSFNALREDFADLRGEMRSKFDMAAAGQQQIVTLLHTERQRPAHMVYLLRLRFHTTVSGRMWQYRMLFRPIPTSPYAFVD